MAEVQDCTAAVGERIEVKVLELDAQANLVCRPVKAAAVRGRRP